MVTYDTIQMVTREMGGAGVDAKVIGEVPSSGNKVDHGDDGNLWGGRGVGIPPGGGGTGIRRTSPHKRVH